MSAGEKVGVQWALLQNVYAAQAVERRLGDLLRFEAGDV